MKREEIEALSDDDLRELLSLVVSVSHLRFRINTGNPRPDSRAAKLASMAVGQSILIEGVQEYPSKWTGTSADYARKRLVNPTARWSYKRTNKGLRIKRES